MHSSIFVLLAAAASVMAAPQQPTLTPTSSIAAGPSAPSGPKPTGTNLPIGSECDPALTGACANGADCYATNFMLMPRCGNFQSTCTTDSQCAYNQCLGGVCSGPPLGTALPTASATTLTTSSLPVGPSAPSGPKPTGTNLPLGANCDPALTNACADGVNCYATNFMLMPRCGNFQSTCKSDAQCAYNTCNAGLCNGFLPSSAYPAATGTTVARSAPAPISTGNSTAPGGNTTVTGRPVPTGTNSGAGQLAGGLGSLLAAGVFVALLL